MAKISPVSIKYMIHANFESEGPLEKPDVIGAIFGQTEGLLGTELEMRELQKEGKIGRIEVDLSMVDGRTVGEIKVPSALDKSETTIIAATLETIDRIGPTEAKIKVAKIEDVRGNKRQFILERARALLENLDNAGDAEMSRTLRDESRVAKVQEYGAEKLPAGDLSGHEIIVVEGRADVVNLVKNRVFNVIGMSGAKLPKEIAELGKSKELTLFVDGDRGGKLIARNVIDNAKVTYIAFAPDGKEVEELTGKEILMSLRRKIPVNEFLGKRTTPVFHEEEEAQIPEFSGDVKKELKDKYSEIEGSKKVMLLDNALDVVKVLSGAEAMNAIKRSRKKIFAVVIDGAATRSVIQICDEKGITHLAAKNFSYAEGAKVNLISL